MSVVFTPRWSQVIDSNVEGWILFVWLQIFRNNAFLPNNAVTTFGSGWRWLRMNYAWAQCAAVNHSDHTRTHTHTHSSLTLSYSHTIVARRTHTVHSHSCITKAEHTHTHEQTPLWQIWHPPPVVTFLQPPPPSIMGAIPVTGGCARCRKVLKSCRVFPVNLLSLLYVVVQMFWGEVCRRRRMARYNSSKRLAAGGAGTRHGKRRRVSLQVTGHVSRNLRFVLITFTFTEIVPHFHKTRRTLTQTHCWDAACVFFSGISGLFRSFCFRWQLITSSARHQRRTWWSMTETEITATIRANKFSFNEILEQPVWITDHRFRPGVTILSSFYYSRPHLEVISASCCQPFVT